MAYMVFVSYSTKDLPLVRELRQVLNQAGINCFIAEYSVLPGTPLSEKIIAAIKAADLFILLWSANSQKSEWVSQEIGIAKSIGRRIIPVMLDENLSYPSFHGH